MGHVPPSTAVSARSGEAAPASVERLSVGTERRLALAAERAGHRR